MDISGGPSVYTVGDLEVQPQSGLWGPPEEAGEQLELSKLYSV